MSQWKLLFNMLSSIVKMDGKAFALKAVAKLRYKNLPNVYRLLNHEVSSIHMHI